ncbi:superfamily I DNA and RNA helicase-like protein [Actinosynnema mirum DSM 43827]|uniref:Superfamily I DNA and RNA helicase-like protein n=1 Tax=Actinosynnema mirum (strain ATCC 29888 / DSM 43827 / JCM 3225 / NBRC 14064 / NCIMB 13271 / NRRL B-12336 / IMRU 3971 / 101) TaxID=446462 RepID=C6WS45_ACTMD|nr:superfamily I DNA and RNA helicase-like protein [Actinosynnema mirum DSM 43827]
MGNPSVELAAERARSAERYRRLDAERAEARRRLDAVLADHTDLPWQREVAARTLTDRLAGLTAADSGLCFGRTDHVDGGTTYVGRTGLADDEQGTLLVDWRAPAARPFYTATGARPEGVTRRRHFHGRGRVLEEFHDDELGADRSSLLRALAAPRDGEMRDIVATIQAEQDEVIRLGHRGVLVVEGGPGTGKTAVALHRTAYLLYAHRDRLSRSGVLLVGPNPLFLRHVGRVLPSLGENDVVFATPGELFPGVVAVAEDEPEVRGLKGGLGVLDVLREAVADRQELPDDPLPVELEDVTVPVTAAVAEVARTRTRELGLRHNAARSAFHRHLAEALVEPAVALIGFDWPELVADVRRELRAHPAVRAAADRLWPELTPQRLLADFYGGRCLALGYPELHRERGDAWTVSDVPLLDEAAELLGDDGSATRAARARRRADVEYAQGVLHVIDTDAELHEEELRAVDLVHAEWLADRHETRDHRSLAERAEVDREWVYGHVVVDEAQELSEMDWRVLMRRCPSRSMTIVGDRAQRQSECGTADWGRALGPYVADRWVHRTLTVNYRSTEEIMTLAAESLAEADPTAVPPTSVRHGEEPWFATVAEAGELESLIAEARPQDGTFAVITPDGPLTPKRAKGVEFDDVLVIDPHRMTPAERYVALTRATRRLGVVRIGGGGRGGGEVMGER